MLYRYGASSLGTIPNSARLVEMYRHPSLEFVVSQAIWLENEAQFADVILPACTSLERWDIAEFANCGGFIHHGQNQVNHRMAVLQHKCIEPLGESKSDYQIFLDILTRLGLGAMFSEGGCSELDWCKRIFDSSDLPKVVSWKDFLKKGYHVIGPGPEAARPPVDMRWYAEGRAKDTPEPLPLPGQYGEEFLKGLPTQSGKFEFVASSLAPDREGRSAASRAQPLLRELGGPGHARPRAAVSAAADHGSPALQLSHLRRRQGVFHQRPRRSPRPGRWLSVLDPAHQRARRADARDPPA